MFWVYILYSKNLGKYYVGSTNDVSDRLKRHNAGQGNFTSTGVPWTLVHTFESATRSEALLLEKKIKKRGIKRFLADQNIN